MTKYREIPEDRILKFKATPGFKGWEHFFDRKSIVHPAKMNLNLLRWILSNYTKESDTVLDPMAGTGSTAVLASALGRNGIALEYEPKFCRMIEENFQKIRNHETLTSKGTMVCINGDARELSKYLEESDIIISSPPYGNRLSDVGVQDGDPARMGYRQAIDVVLTSPPYENTLTGGGQRDKEGFTQGHTRGEHCFKDGYSKVDSIITSPPYGSDNANLMGRDDKYAKSILSKTGVRSVDLNSDNLGNLKYGEIDAVITSPPYEKSMGIKNPVPNMTEDAKRTWWANYRSQGGGMNFEDFIKYQEQMEYSYSKDSENIGNLKSDSYLDAMLQVYSESFKVLKPLGKLVLVVKNFIRDKNVVRLDLDTIKLCEKAGFKLIDRLYFDLPVKSFWKRIYQQKYPDVPEVKYEDILIFEKPFDIKGVISKNE